ncbi:flavodoxin [uncultured Imperialibacter sp.]|uniref:flavodoxin n=1 Tax=uncultured Imperialibacter sp. TaxID=1672639 RepID=UPI0030DD06FD|tara:strand:+ start:52910 stop:53413 length:504 start_codon:yes stop_codon:yes gene_type:complete
MAKIGIFFGSTEGHTEGVVNKIQELFGDDAELVNVNSASADDMDPFPYLILACPTWEIGRLQEDWDGFIDEIEEVNYEGKKVAYLGLGDADGYPDTFLDALGIIHDRIKDKGATFVGAWPTEGYNFEASKGVVDGKFLGLAIDEDNQSDLTDARVRQWVVDLKKEFT